MPRRRLLRPRLLRPRLLRPLIFLVAILALLAAGSGAAKAETSAEDQVIERILDLTGGLITIIFTPDQ